MKSHDAVHQVDKENPGGKSLYQMTGKYKPSIDSNSSPSIPFIIFFNQSKQEQFECVQMTRIHISHYFNK